jgi:CDP-glycerol glycerophosphotransferase (TagB/SpsB family)
VAGDNTAYPYTDREVKRTGLPRHDRLLRIAKAMPPAEVNTLLVMPTWRGGLVDGRLAACNAAEQMALFAASDYARHWREFLRNDELREMAAKANQRVVFMPHANAAKYIEAFDPPSHVQVVMAETSHIQTTFARAAAFVTDYTSVAFTMAFLRRPVFYYQFDQERFYSGDHNWRLGYFDYERDGFGPVALSESDLMDGLRRYFGNGLKSEREYLLRMERAMPEQDELACHRVYASVLGLRAPFASC